MSKNTGYFPFGFRYPKGYVYSESNPDPGIESIRKRMLYLNKVHALSGLPGHIFAAAMAMFQNESRYEPEQFWNEIRRWLTMQEVADIAVSMQHLVADEPPRLEFPNAVALFDCRFVSTKEWEHIRRYSIGGSEAAAVLGVAKYQSARTLYFEKKNPSKEKRSIDSQQILDYGHAVEPYIIGEIASRLGAKQWPEYRMFAHKDYPFITCNPDGILVFPDGHLALFEAKTAFWKKREEWKQDIPDYYKPQPRQYLGVLNDPRLNSGYIGVCLGGLPRDLLCHDYTRDLEAEAAQIRQIVKYWHKYIARNVAPPFSGNSELDFNANYGYDNFSEVCAGKQVLSDDTIPLFERYFALKGEAALLADEIKIAKAKENELKEQIKEAAQEGLTICACPGKPTYKIKVSSYSTSSVSTKNVEAKDPVAAKHLMELAWLARGTRLNSDWTTPKVTMAVPKPTKKTK